MNGRYNGWKNYATWNISLWLGNDEGLYNFARHYTEYERLAKELKESGIYITPDGVSYTDPTLDLDELNNFLNEIQGYDNE